MQAESSFIVPCLVPSGDKTDFFFASLLSPIGEHRSRYISPSKGKRARKRKRIANHRKRYGEEGADSTVHEHDQRGPPPLSPLPPEITAFLSIGFNSTERRLEAAVQRPIPIGISNQVASEACEANLKPLVAVFIDRSDQAPILYSHLPQLLATASMSVPSEPAILLVTLPKGSTARLSIALHIPRVSVVGLERDAPNTRPLVEFIREHVAPIEIPWLKNIQEGWYMPVVIESVTRDSPSKVEKASQPTFTPQAKKQYTKARNRQQIPQ
ncbi:hypothetical protein MMC30_003203 [Trapelia coarctata]|nr:hypothetical protein [Trapelia coarctata]